MTEPQNDLDTRFLVETPERVVISHDVAGIGSRFAAGAIDVLFLSAPLCVASVVATVILGVGRSNNLSAEELQSVGLAIGAAVNLVIWGYYILLECLWGGKTLGKHFMRLRVVSVNGGRASLPSLVLRNLLRVFDQLPGLAHLVGGIVMFANGRGRRLGDLVAGTIVVHERRAPSVSDRQGSTVTASVEGLSGDEAHLVRLFLDRRGELRPSVRMSLAARIVARLSTRHSLPAAAPEHLLALLGQGHAPAELRELAGPKEPAAAASSPVVGDTP